MITIAAVVQPASHEDNRIPAAYSSNADAKADSDPAQYNTFRFSPNKRNK